MSFQAQVFTLILRCPQAGGPSCSLRDREPSRASTARAGSSLCYLREESRAWQGWQPGATRSSDHQASPGPSWKCEPEPGLVMVSMERRSTEIPMEAQSGMPAHRWESRPRRPRAEFRNSLSRAKNTGLKSQPKWSP